MSEDKQQQAREYLDLVHFYYSYNIYRSERDYKIVRKSMTTL